MNPSTPQKAEILFYLANRGRFSIHLMNPPRGEIYFEFGLFFQIVYRTVLELSLDSSPGFGRSLAALFDQDFQ